MPLWLKIGLGIVLLSVIGNALPETEESKAEKAEQERIEDRCYEQMVLHARLNAPMSKDEQLDYYEECLDDNWYYDLDER